MFATPIGGLGGPEKTPQGWVIWRIDTATAGVKRTFEQARDMVERDYRILEADRILKEKLAALRQAAHVKIFEDRVTLDLGKGGPWDE
jgi:parvulin-like peptidyl-prolyl isomerase